MKANIVITLDGEVSIITQEGDFETGKAKIEQLIEELKILGVDLNLEKSIEQHRHDDEKVLAKNKISQ